jgi:hypothetical protein
MNAVQTVKPVLTFFAEDFGLILATTNKELKCPH